jgi:hypothetical protein
MPTWHSTLYRRHRQGCEGGHPADLRSGEFDERKKGWKRCACVIFVSGTLDRKFARKAAATADWAEAHRIAESYSKAASRTGQAPQPVVEMPPPSGPTRITIEDAVSLYLANREASVAHPPYRKYRTFTKQLVAFADPLGYVMLDQFRPADIDVFYTKSKLGPRSKAKMLDRLRGFFRFAVHRDWIPKSPVSPDLKPPAGSTKAANKMPFTDEQVNDILKACDQCEDRPWANRFGSGMWTGEDMKGFIWVSTPACASPTACCSTWSGCAGASRRVSSPRSGQPSWIPRPPCVTIDERCACGAHATALSSLPVQLRLHGSNERLPRAA